MDTLESLRQEIDQIDEKILECIAARFAIVEKLGRIKRAAQLPLQQKEREQEVLAARREKAYKMGLSEDMTTQIFRVLLAESLRFQSKKN